MCNANVTTSEDYYLPVVSSRMERAAVVREGDE
jgi:hypothetical protein